MENRQTGNRLLFVMRDPTANKAIAHVMREKSPKEPRAPRSPSAIRYHETQGTGKSVNINKAEFIYSKLKREIRKNQDVCQEEGK